MAHGVATAGLKLLWGGFPATMTREGRLRLIRESARAVRDYGEVGRIDQ